MYEMIFAKYLNLNYELSKHSPHPIRLLVMRSSGRLSNPKESRPVIVRALKMLERRREDPCLWMKQGNELL